jgi:hypothetical protein
MKRALKRKIAPAAMVTVVCYRPRQQEYFLFVTHSSSVIQLTEAASLQYPEDERKDIHIVTILEGVCNVIPGYEDHAGGVSNV